MGSVVSAVNSLVGGGGGGAPAAPDYTSAANQTAANNLKAAQAATAANRVNQTTPYGSLNYTQTGTDSMGNPMWSANQTANSALQPAIDTSLSQVASQYANPFTGGNLPSYGIDPGQTYSDAIMKRLQPQQQHQSEMSDQQLANQGIMPGSEAYNNAKRLLGQTQNDQLTSAIVGGMNTGLQANQQQYAQNLQNYQLPMNVASSLKSLSTPNYINPAQQQTTAGADILGATNAQYQNQLAAYNASQANQTNQLNGLLGLGGTLGAAALMPAPIAGLTALSDIRTKENIKAIGWLPNGLPVYEFEYKKEFKDQAGHGKHIGVMAQEVEKVIPNAVITRADGYKAVNYGAL